MAAFFIYRFVSGNCGPTLLSDASENFKEDNGIILSGPLGKHSQSDVREVYPFRYFFLLKGELCYSAKWLWNAEKAMATALDKRRIYCSPFLKVERISSFVNLTVNMDDVAPLSFLMLNDTDNTTSQLKLSVRATDQESAIIWEKKIKSQVEKISLPSRILCDVLRDLNFPSNLNKAIWNLVLYGNRNLFTFFTSCVSHDMDEDLVDRIDEKSCIYMFYHLHKTVGDICLETANPPDEIALAYVLHRATRNTFDRVLLLITDISPSAVTDFSSGTDLKDSLESLVKKGVSISVSAALALGKLMNLSPCSLFFHVALSLFSDTGDESTGFEKIIRDAILIALEHPSRHAELIDETISTAPQGGMRFFLSLTSLCHGTDELYKNFHGLYLLFP